MCMFGFPSISWFDPWPSRSGIHWNSLWPGRSVFSLAVAGSGADPIEKI